MKKIPYIHEFIVIKPTNDMETVDEVLSLSPFGEYCPANSMRGYQLLYLLSMPKHYLPRLIMEIDINDN